MVPLIAPIASCNAPATGRSQTNRRPATIITSPEAISPIKRRQRQLNAGPHYKFSMNMLMRNPYKIVTFEPPTITCILVIMKQRPHQVEPSTVLSIMLNPLDKHELLKEPS